MKRAELVRLLAEQCGIPRCRAAGALRHLAARMRESLLTRGELPLWGLGKVKVVGRAARTARNPKTGEAISLPARKGLIFRPSRGVKEALR